MLFRRQYTGFSGGHLKVWHYFQHVESSRLFTPRIFFTPDSSVDADQPWRHDPDHIVNQWTPEQADVLFLAGRDWDGIAPAMRPRFKKPVINLIQGVRHADERPLRDYLTLRALRICVSQEVADAIQATGAVNGPVVTIPNGIDVETLPAPAAQRSARILIAGMKNPTLAGQIAEALKPQAVRCLTAQTARAHFLAALADSDIAVLLPLPAEGFYLPALEAMALGCLVICPDCIGNRSFCLDGINCLRPRYALADILSAIDAASSFDAARAAEIRASAGEMVARHDLRYERSTFLNLLEHHHEWWNAEVAVR